MALGEGTLIIQSDNGPEELGRDIDVGWVLLRTPLGNRFPLRISKTVDKGYLLSQGKAVKISNTNLSDVYIIGRQNDKVDYSYLEKGIDNELTSRVLLENLLKELKIMNIQLSIITDEELEVQ